jgi:hypothetical protein
MGGGGTKEEGTRLKREERTKERRSRERRTEQVIGCLAQGNIEVGLMPEGAEDL